MLLQLGGKSRGGLLELSAKFQSNAGTGTLAVVYKEHYDPNTRFSRHLAGSKPCAAGCFSCRKWLPEIADYTATPHQHWISGCVVTVVAYDVTSDLISLL